MSSAPSTPPESTTGDIPRGSRSEAATRPPSRVFGWDKGDLAITDEEQRNRYRRPNLSPSTSKAMEGCPARWAAEKALPQADNPFGAAELGTSAHSVMEDLFDINQVDPKDRTPETAMLILLKHSKVVWPGKDEVTYAKRGQWISAVHDAYKGLFDIEDPKTVAVHSIEMGVGQPGGKYEAEIHGVPFIGFIDRVDHTPDGLRPVDYKSSAKRRPLKFGDDHGDQVRLYAEVLRQIEGAMPKTAGLYYTRLGQSRIVNIKPAEMRKVLGRFKKSWGALNLYIDKGAFPTKASPLCGWCPLVNSCPTAAANGFGPKVDGVMTKAELGIPILRTFEAGDLHAITEKRAATKRPSADLDFGSAMNGDPVEPTVPSEIDVFDVPPALPEDPADSTDGPPAVDEPAFNVPDVLVGAIPFDPENPEPVAETGSAYAPSAHLEVDLPTTHQKGNTMNTLLVEDKPWEETIGGNLNPNSYAATAVWGLASLAYEEISKSDVYEKPTRALIDGLTVTLGYMVDKVQNGLTGISSFQDGTNTRLRGALRSYITANPIPFGKDRAEWDEWVALGIKHINAISLAAIRLFEADLSGSDGAEAPWAVFAAENVVSGAA